MNLIDQIVINKVYGEGKIIEQSENCLNILFAVGEKKFVFPDAFKGFLVAKDTIIADEIQKFIEKFESRKQRVKQDKLNEMQYKLEQRHASTKSASSMAKKKMHTCANIAFKCNYCDGGKSEEQVGFEGVCSDDSLRNNIKVERRVECCSENSQCLKYLKGDIPREELSDLSKTDEFSCHESKMLRDWKVFSGTIKTGVNKGKPTKLSRVRPNSLCVLTTRDPKATEKDRYVFATYLVDETYESNGKEDGYVSTQSEYKIKLSPTEAKSLLFWNYHTNENHPETAVWGSGLHRYFQNDQAAQLLRDIAKIKKGTPDEALAERFFRHFCRMNTINVNTLKQPSGVLSV
ncbi:MAG: hypothetical protein WBH44_05725 [Proteocatella sp.]